MKRKNNKIFKPSLYIETTVISYFTSLPSRDLIIAGHQKVTQEWWDNKLHLFEAFISEIIFEEISKGDSTAVQKRLKAVKGFKYLAVTQEVLDLAEEYYKILNLPDKARLDAVHLALAVQHGIDYLVSWNFAHISGAYPRNAIEKENYKRGIETPVICTPEELMEE